jgi:hypothetical protein
MTSLQAVGFNNGSSGAFARTQRNSRPQVRACKPTQFLNADLPTLQDPKADSQLGELQVAEPAESACCHQLVYKRYPVVQILNTTQMSTQPPHKFKGLICNNVTPQV